MFLELTFSLKYQIMERLSVALLTQLPAANIDTLQTPLIVLSSPNMETVCAIAQPEGVESTPERLCGRPVP